MIDNDRNSDEFMNDPLRGHAREERASGSEALDEHYRLILDNADDVIWLWDLRIRKYLYVSPSAVKLFGYTAGEMMGFPLSHVIPEESMWLVREELPARIMAMESGDDTARTRTYDVDVVCSDGSQVPAEIVTTFLSDDRGRVIYVHGVTRNETRKRNAENLLRQSEERYRSIFQNSLAVLYLIDPDDGSIVDANPAAARFYGYSMETLKTMNISQINIAGRETIDEALKTSGKKKGYIYHFRHRLAGGEIKSVEVAGSPIRIGTKIYLYTIVNDITERKKAEEDRERLITELTEALSRIKTLSGMLPICSSCKKIRDDRGYWNQIESYIRDHSDAEFTHGLCPDCIKRLYPGIRGTDSA
jgi:PAS domain S-box-containing protein